MLVRESKEIPIKCIVNRVHKQCRRFANKNGLTHVIRGIKYKDAVSWIYHNDNPDCYICIAGYVPQTKKRIYVFGDSPYISDLENFIKKIV